MASSLSRAPFRFLLLRHRSLLHICSSTRRLFLCQVGPTRIRGIKTRHIDRSNKRSMASSVNSTSTAVSVLSERENEDAFNVQLLNAINDDHGGVIVEMETLMDPKVFASSLRASISKWREQGVRGVWIKLPIALANLVEPAVAQGFWYHHAEKSHLMLVYWIPNTPNSIPANATHRVGVGAFIMNDKREVLVVQEKSGKFRGTGIWKFPTGVVEPGEDIHVGAVREVKEETGVDTEFVEILTFRESHMSFFDKSDLFFVCMLRPLSSEIEKQESEIEAAQWMPIEEFSEQPFVKKHELVKYIIDVGMAKIDKEYAGFSPVCITSAFMDEKSCLYLNKRDLKQASGESTANNSS